MHFSSLIRNVKNGREIYKTLLFENSKSGKVQVICQNFVMFFYQLLPNENVCSAAVPRVPFFEMLKRIQKRPRWTIHDFFGNSSFIRVVSGIKLMKQGYSLKNATEKAHYYQTIDHSSNLHINFACWRNVLNQNQVVQHIRDKTFSIDELRNFSRQLHMVVDFFTLFRENRKYLAVVLASLLLLQSCYYAFYFSNTLIVKLVFVKKWRRILSIRFAQTF